MSNNISVIGIIPEYPTHAQQNVYGKVRMPPVGIISVLAQIKDNPNLKEVYAIDENNYRGPRDFMGQVDHKFLQKREPAKIAMFYGGMSNSIPRLFSVAKQYKDFGSITIAGGSHVDALPKEALKSGVDIVVHGEGEETIKEIMKSLVKDDSVKLDAKELKNIKGISFLGKGGKYIFTGKRKPIADLNKIKDTDLTLIKFLKKRWSAIPINKGRGCNWNCEFCVVNTQYGRYKSCSVEKALNQLIKYSDMGYKFFFFTDDNFAQNPKEAIELCTKIGEFRRKFRRRMEIMVQIRTEYAENDRLLEAMRFAGVKSLAIGYESPINEELTSMKKGVTVEKLIERSRKLSKYFFLHGMFIFGYPSFKDSIHKSKLTLRKRAKAYKKFFKKAKIDTVQVLNAVPLPGSRLREKLEAEKRLLPKEMVDWDKYDGSFLCYNPIPDGFDPYELQTIPRVLMKRWYLGCFIIRRLNYLKWMDWLYTAIGFPLQFSLLYLNRFVHKLVEKKRENNVLLPKRNIFHAALLSTWMDIERRWRNLFIKTYGGQIVSRWFSEYRKSDYRLKLRKLFSKQTKKKSVSASD